MNRRLVPTRLLSFCCVVLLAITGWYGCNLKGYDCVGATDCQQQETCIQGWCVPTPPLTTPPAICKNGETRSCYTGTTNTKNRGICRAGEQTCTNHTWGSCQNEITPANEVCNGKDDDCNGQTDELTSCKCKPGQTRICYDGPPHTQDKGNCHTGTQACQPNGTWGKCAGQITPQIEQCNKLDDDCDGQIDNAAGLLSLTRPCYTGKDPLSASKGNCKKGQQTCRNGEWDTLCIGEVLPTTERCNGLDDDCDGRVDETCGQCAPKQSKGFISDPFQHNAERIVWTRNHAYIIAASKRTIQFWHYPQQAHLRSLLVSSDIRHIVAGPLSQTLAIALANGTIELRSIPSGILLHSLRKHQHSASTMLFVNGESELISHATNETNVLHWKIGPNPKATQLLVLPDASTRVFAVSPQGTYLAAASTNTATLQLITLTNNQPNGSHQPCPNGYVNLQFQTEEDISLLCNETSGFQLATYNWKQKSTRMRHKLPINDVDGSVFAKSGKELLVFSKSNANPSLFDTNTGQLKQVFSLGQLRPGTAALTEGSFRADGAFIAFVNGSERLWLWQIGSKQPGGFFEKTLQRHRGPIHSMVADPKGKWLATTGPDSSIKLWNISVQSTLYGTLQVELQGPTGGGGVLAVSPNGRWLAASDVHNQIVLWDLLSHQIKATMPKHTSTITHLAFSAFGTRLISVSKDDDTAIVWSVPDGNFLSFLAHQDVSFVTHHPFLPKVALGRTNQLIVQKLSIESPADNTHTITHTIPQRGLLSWLGFATGNTLVFVNEHVYTKDWTNPKSQATQLLSTSTTNPFVALHANKQLLAIQDGRDIAFYNLKEKKQLTHLIQHTAQRRDITAIAFGPHANLFFTAHDNGWIQSWSCPPNGTTP